VSIQDDLDAASETIDRVYAALQHRDRRKACPRPCPDKKANKGRPKGEPKHVCELVPGDQMTPMERMRNASPAQIQAQRYDRPGGKGGGRSDPTARVAEAAVDGNRIDVDTVMRRAFANATSKYHQAARIARRGIPPKRTPEHRALAQLAEQARKAAHEADLIVMRWGPPQPATQHDRKRLDQANTTPPPDCRFCGDTVIPAGDGGYEVTARGNLEPGPTCDWCASIVIRTGKAPTKKMLNDHRAGRQVRIPAPNHVEAS
jgi:hypothetical protein